MRESPGGSLSPLRERGGSGWRGEAAGRRRALALRSRWTEGTDTGRGPRRGCDCELPLRDARRGGWRWREFRTPKILGSAASNPGLPGYGSDGINDSPFSRPPSARVAVYPRGWRSIRADGGLSARVAVYPRGWRSIRAGGGVVKGESCTPSQRCALPRPRPAGPQRHALGRLGDMALRKIVKTRSRSPSARRA